jgi:hypothetical protein
MADVSLVHGRCQPQTRSVSRIYRSLFLIYPGDYLAGVRHKPTDVGRFPGAASIEPVAFSGKKIADQLRPLLELETNLPENLGADSPENSTLPIFLPATIQWRQLKRHSLTVKRAMLLCNSCKNLHAVPEGLFRYWLSLALRSLHGQNSRAICLSTTEDESAQWPGLPIIMVEARRHCPSLSGSCVELH